MVNQAFLDKFKRLYKEKYNIILCDEEATELATQFLNLMKILIQPEQKTHRKIDEKQQCLIEYK